MFRIFATQQKSPMIESSAPQDEQANNPSEHLRKLNAEIALEKILLDQLRAEVSNVVIGQSAMIDALIIALLTEGHVLLEGMPGLAKNFSCPFTFRNYESGFWTYSIYSGPVTC